MPIRIVRDDITKMKADAIVNAANSSLLGGGGVDGCIHRAAGPELLAECRSLGGCDIGDAKVTGAYRLPCKYVIHTVGPVWRGGNYGERELLACCYRRSLELALERGCETVAFPLISSGAYGYPKDQALRVAMETIGEFLLNHDLTVYIVVFDKASYQIGGKLFSDIAAYIDQRYVDEHTDSALERSRQQALWNAPMACPPPMHQEGAQTEGHSSELGKGRPLLAGIAAPASLNDALKQLDEGFSQALLRHIDQKGMTDAQCYKKANIDRKLFSKIRSNPTYRPSKPTALAFAVALELSLDETEELLKKAGFALSRSSKFDIIVEYFISRGCYDVFTINEALFAFDQSLLGG